MKFNYAEFEERITKGLQDSGLIEKFSTYEIGKSPELDTIIKIFEKPHIISYDEGGIYYVDENSDKVYCPGMLTTISDKGLWLSDMLPDIGFDIDQNGNVRKAGESEALYIVSQIAHILKDDSFKNELIEFAKDYDFGEMRCNVEFSENFRSLLTKWQSLQSQIINIIVSACKFKISSQKKSIEKFMRDGLSDSVVAELRNLESSIRGINFKASEGALSPTNVKKLTKIERLQAINLRDDEIASTITKSRVGNLFKITTLSSEYISPVKKKKISLWVLNYVDKLLEDPIFFNMREERQSLIANFTKRAYKFEKTSIRRLNIEKYISEGENFRMPSKM